MSVGEEIANLSDASSVTETSLAGVRLALTFFADQSYLLSSDKALQSFHLSKFEIKKKRDGYLVLQGFIFFLKFIDISFHGAVFGLLLEAAFLG